MLLNLFNSLLKAPTWREAQWIVEQHHDILLNDPKIDSYIQSLVEEQENDRTQQSLEEIRVLLMHCREIGIDQAFEEKIHTVVRQEPQRIRRQLDFESLNMTADKAVQLLTAMRLSVKMNTQDIIRLWQESPELASIAHNQEALFSLLRRYPDLAVILDLPSSEFTSDPEYEYTQIEAPIEFQDEIFQLNYLEDRLLNNPDVATSLINYYERFLTKLNPEIYRKFTASILFQLGSTYLQLQTGDRLYNIRQSIKYLLKSKELLLDSDVDPINYGFTLSQLGTAYSGLLGTSNELYNLIQAQQCYLKALKILNPEVTPRLYASTLMNLGKLYMSMPDGLEGNLRQAINYYEEALHIYKPETAPLKYALTQHNLGIAYGQLPTNRQENLQQAIKCFKEALRFRTPALPFDYACTLHNLGVAYSELPDQSIDTCSEAISYLQAALQLYTPNNTPVQCRRTAMLLGDIYARLEEWSSAIKAYDLAWSAGKELYRFSFIPISQQTEIETNSALCDRLLTACLHFKDDPVFARQALIYAEEGKARTFLEQMGQGNFPFPSSIPEEERDKEKELLAQLRQIEQKLIIPNLSLTEIEQYAKERRDLKDQLNEFWNNLCSNYPVAKDYVNLRQAQPPTWDELIELAHNLGSEIALVEFYILSDEIIVFIVRDGFGTPRIFTLPISQKHFMGRYFKKYQEEVWEDNGLSRRYEWLKLGKELLEPLLEDIETAKIIYFIPHWELHIMPLHALTVMGKPFISHYAVIYSPSLAVLKRTLQNFPDSRINTSALVMGDFDVYRYDCYLLAITKLLSDQYLRLLVFYLHTLIQERQQKQLKQQVFIGEAEEVAKQFGCQPYLNSAANIPTLLQLAPTAHHIHLSCHGNFSAGNALDSCIHLYDGEFTARQWMETRLQADLVTLSACETGISKVSSGDEIVGIARALLYAGASTVLLTLWSVNPHTTKEWMLDFYQKTWEQSVGKLKEEAYAFREATLSLFNKYPKDPRIWAAFFLVGDWR